MKGYTTKVWHRPWKMVVGRLLSYWEGNFSGAMSNFRGVWSGSGKWNRENVKFFCKEIHQSWNTWTGLMQQLTNKQNKSSILGIHVSAYISWNVTFHIWLHKVFNHPLEFLSLNSVLLQYLNSLRVSICSKSVQNISTILATLEIKFNKCISTKHLPTGQPPLTN